MQRLIEFGGIVEQNVNVNSNQNIYNSQHTYVENIEFKKSMA
jgi:hypothetical protein